MRTAAISLVLSILCLVGSTTHAQPRAFFKDGNALLAGLKAVPGSPENAYAAGYVVASGEALNEERSLSFKMCLTIPKNATQRQLIDIVQQFLEHNPAVRDMPAPWLVAYALQRPFPCEGFSTSAQQAPK